MSAAIHIERNPTDNSIEVSVEHTCEKCGNKKTIGAQVAAEFVELTVAAACKDCAVKSPQQELFLDNNHESVPPSAAEASVAQSPADSSPTLAAGNGGDSLAATQENSVANLPSVPSQPAEAASLPAGSGADTTATIAAANVGGEALPAGPADSGSNNEATTASVAAQPGTADAGNPPTTGSADQAGGIAASSDVNVSTGNIQPTITQTIPAEFFQPCNDKAVDAISPNIIGVMHFYEFAPGETQQTTPQELVGKRWVSISHAPACDCVAEYLTGIPCNSGVLKYDELKAAANTPEPGAVVPHALAVLTSVLRPNIFIQPATHTDNADAFRANLNLFPIAGLRIRLKAAFNMTGFGPLSRAVLRTLQTYGAIVVERGTRENGQPINPFKLVCDLPNLTAEEANDLNGLSQLANDTFLNSLEVVKVEKETVTWVGGEPADQAAVAILN